MDLKSFSDVQRRAVLDLAILAMYADAHLATTEHARVERLLSAMGLVEEWERAAEFDAAVSRVRPYTGSPEAARTYGMALVRIFGEPEQRKMVHALLHDLVASDGKLSPQEGVFLGAVREALAL